MNINLVYNVIKKGGIVKKKILIGLSLLIIIGCSGVQNKKVKNYIITENGIIYKDGVDYQKVNFDKKDFEKIYRIADNIFYGNDGKNNGSGDTLDDLFNSAKLLPEYNKALNIFIKLAKSGDLKSKKRVAKIFENGAGFRKGDKIEKNMELAFFWHLEAAKAGDVESQFWIGESYLKGKIIKQNNEKALEWFIKSANFYMPAQRELGVIYGEGELVKQDILKSKNYLKMAAKSGDNLSQYYYAVVLHKEKGLTEEALSYYEKSAKQGNKFAIEELSMIYEDYAKAGSKKYQLKIAKYYDYNNENDTALFWYEESNSLWGKYAMSTLYKKGLFGIKKDEELANKILKDNYDKFLEKAKDGDFKFQFVVAEIYKNGEIVKKDIDKALIWYEKSAKAGFRESQYVLGDFYYWGRGVDKDYKKSYYWIEKSAGQGHSVACDYLANLYKYGYGVKKDYKKSIYWSKRAHIKIIWD